MARVQTIINQLLDLNPDDEIIIGYWTKETADEYVEDTNKPLTTDQWEEIVDEVGLENGYFENLGEWIQDLAYEKAEKLDEEGDE